MAKVREGHVSITWWVWLGVGAFVAVYALIVKAKDPGNGPMTLFFWIGIVLAIVGAGKFMLKKKLADENKTLAREEQKFSGQLQRQEQQWRQASAQQQEGYGAQQRGPVQARPQAGYGTPQGGYQQQAVQQRPVNAQGQAPRHHPASASIIICPSCNTKNHASSTACFRCGMRLR